MGRKILITSGKGGVGKTTITAGLGIALAKMGLSVVIVDADMGLNNLDAIMNIEGKIQYDLNDYLCGKCRLKQCLLVDRVFGNLYTLPVTTEGQKSQFLESFEDLMDKLSRVFDYCLIDCPAGIENNFKQALSGASEAIVVVTPHLSSIRDADKVLSILDGAGVPLAGIVVNRIRGDLVVSKQMLSHLSIEKLVGRKVLGCVPESDLINVHTSFRFDIVAKKEEGLAFEYLSQNLHNGKQKMVDYTRRYKGLVGGIRRVLKRNA